MTPRPELLLIDPPASPEEAAAVVAALDRFLRDTAPEPEPGREPPGRSAWARAALLDATGHPPERGAAWGRSARGRVL